MAHDAPESRAGGAPRDVRMVLLSRMGEKIVDQILFGFPRVDIDIAISRMRDRCEEWFPDRLELFEMVYESRFDRIWEQFRDQE